MAKVGIDANLKLAAPSGGLVQIRTHETSGNINVRCSEPEAIWDLFQLTRAVGTPSFSLRNLRKLRSPLVQTVVVNIGEKELLTWEPDRFPKVRSVRLLFRLLRERG